MTVQQQTSLFSPYQLGPIALANRVVMAPMTRSRAIGNVPNELMARFYGARADAGLLITEGTAPAPDGLGYARIPGIYTDEQVAGWKLVTEAVHARGGKIFVQLMHTGRVGHPLNLPAGAELLAPSAIAAPGAMWTDQEQLQPHPVPREMTAADIRKAVDGFAYAANRAIEAGFDGVELHGANGYLIEQFLNPAANERKDAYGSDRNRFALEVVEAVAAAIGAERVGIRLSPYSVAQGHVPFDGIDEQYAALAKALGALGLAYVHVVDHSALGAPPVPQAVKDLIRRNFGRTYITAGGYDRATAEQDLEAGKGDLVAFGRPFIANPDYVSKLQSGAALTPANAETFYTPGEAGYTDY
ncbi:MAG: alkene reductase [Cyanobacteria bacterium RYN_339]|nr:alkene reductase [Cyanobacteria bacterium RYN_339]